MNYIYVVTWMIVSFVYDPCPNAGKKNEYGIGNTYTSCAVLHGHNEYESRSRTFATRDSAIAFIDGGKMPITYFSMGGLKDFKLDSIEVK